MILDCPFVQQVPPVDLVPPVAKKKNKRKDKEKSRRHTSPRRSPKRAKASAMEVGSSKGGQLVSHDLAFHKGVNISLSQTKNDVLMSSFKGDIMTNCLELQARAMVVARLLSN